MRVIMAFNASAPNFYDTNLIPWEVRSQYFEEVLLHNNLSAFMGTGDKSLIQIVDKNNGTGKTTTFAFRRKLDYKQVLYDYDQFSGQGQGLKFYEDDVQVRLQVITDGLQGKQLVQLETPIDVYGALKDSLYEAHVLNLTYSLFNSATFGLYPDLANQGPVANRVIYSGAGHQANINAGVAGMNTGTGAAQNGASVALIRKARNIAVKGGATYEVEKRISPFRLEMSNGAPVPTYVVFADTDFCESLASDPAFSAYWQRGIIESPNQPSGLNGAFYKGMIDNVLIYEVPELGLFQVTSGGFRASWALFCGAQAFGLCWHMKPWFAQELTNMGTTVQMAVLEMRGQKPIMFPSFADETTVIQHGIINLFARMA
jgi:hypothetical protein